MTVSPARILLVEDDAIDVMNIRRAFARCETDVPLVVAPDGLAAFHRLCGGLRPPAPADWLILLDLNLPRVGGIEFLQMLRASRELRPLPVVVLTTADADRDRVRTAVGEGLNVVGYVAKPVTMNALLDVVRRLRGYCRTGSMSRVTASA